MPKNQTSDLNHLNTDTPSVASATDMTGLIPANPREDREHYAELYDVDADTRARERSISSARKTPPRP